MKWTREPDDLSTITTVGLRGTYTITKVGAQYWLKGDGHDGLSIWNAPRRFALQEQARIQVEYIDNVKTREATVGGE